MKHIALAQKQRINLVGNTNATPEQAIAEAIAFVKDNKLEYADLNYNGFTFGIDAESKVSDLLADYCYWHKHQLQTAS